MEPTQGRFEVEKFDGEGDFALWKHKMLAQLEILGLDSALKPVSALVQALDTKGKAVEGEDQQKAEEQVKSDPKWLDKDRRVRNLLSMSL